MADRLDPYEIEVVGRDFDREIENFRGFDCSIRYGDVGFIYRGKEIEEFGELLSRLNSFTSEYDGEAELNEGRSIRVKTTVEFLEERDSD